MGKSSGACRIITGDALTVLRTLKAASVQACVTSPPYWGLRDYGLGPAALGLEPTIDLYVAHVVEVFREAHRVLKNDGTLWLNMGDSYANDRKWGGKSGNKNATSDAGGYPRRKVSTGLKPKDLCMMPARVALALQADGWYLRSDIIWHKTNPMPESVTDRPTKSHEYLFLLSKSQKYFCDMDAIKEPCLPDTPRRYERGRGANPKNADGGPGHQTIARTLEPMRLRHSGNKAQTPTWGAGVPREDSGGGRNKRTVWTIPTKPYKGAHFATFPPKLIEPCILAGSRKGDVVLDPFNGAGTTGMVALEHGRRYLGIELNPAYVAMTLERLGIPRTLTAAS